MRLKKIYLHTGSSQGVKWIYFTLIMFDILGRHYNGKGERKYS